MWKLESSFTYFLKSKKLYIPMFVYWVIFGACSELRENQDMRGSMPETQE